MAKVARELDGRLKAVACGSYRRGEAECGDMDVMIVVREAATGTHCDCYVIAM